MWDKFVSQLEAHPYLFGGVAIAVVFFFFWGGGSSGGSTTSAISAAESQAIADSAQANASLQLSNDQVQMNAQNANAAVTINSQNTSSATEINAANNAAAVSAAQIAASANSYNDDTAVKLAGIQRGAQDDLENNIIYSQESAQNWITALENSVSDYQLPNSIETSGFAATFAPKPAPVTNVTYVTPAVHYGFVNLEHSNGTSGAEGANGNGGGDSF